MEENILSSNQMYFIIAFMLLHNVFVFTYCWRRRFSYPTLYGILVVSTWITFIGGLAIIGEAYPPLTFWFAKIMSF